MPARSSVTERFINDDTSDGVVLISFSAPKKLWLYTCSIEIINVDTKVRTWLSGSFLQPDLTDDSVKVVYKAVELPEGDYHILNWQIYRGQSKFVPLGIFTIPFTVRSGHINYIGDYMGLLKNKAGKTPVFMPPTDVYFEVSDRFNSDADMFESKFKHLDLSNVLNAMPDFSGSNTKYSLMYLEGINIP
jgi:hypothetical protein